MFPALNSIIIFVCLLLPITSNALPDDYHKKLNIVADQWHYNYRTGVTVYEGHVHALQGTTHVVADRLITKTNKQHVINEATAYGETERAHYWTTPNLGEKEMHAFANIIKMYPIESNVVLEQEVTVKQGENSFQGQLILYHMSDQTITVPASKDGRAILVYDPDK